MEAIELMYYTITATLIVFIIGVVFAIYQLSLFLFALRKLISQIQSFPLYVKIASSGIQAALLSIALKLFKRKGGV